MEYLNFKDVFTGVLNLAAIGIVGLLLRDKFEGILAQKKTIIILKRDLESCWRKYDDLLKRIRDLEDKYGKL